VKPCLTAAALEKAVWLHFGHLRNRQAQSQSDGRQASGLSRFRRFVMLPAMPRDMPLTADSARLQRGHGVLELGFNAAPGGARLAHLYQRDPCRALFPHPASRDLPLAVAVTTSGGLTGGDRIALSVAAGAGAAVQITTQAAEKIYRASRGETGIGISLRAEAGAVLEWLPQETILFDGARLRRRTEVALAGDAALLACEQVTFGRVARGESFDRGFLLDGWRVRVDGRLVWADALRLEGDIAATRAAPAAFDGARAVAFAILVGAGTTPWTDAARDLVAAAPCRAGVTAIGPVLLARFLDPDPARVRGALAGYVTGLRAAVFGRPARMPSVWYV